MNVAMIFRGTLSSLTGASKVVKTFTESKGLFLDNGVDRFEVFTLSQTSLPPSTVASPSFKKKIRTLIGRKMATTYIGSCASIHYLHIKKAKAVVSKYLSSGIKADVIIFHDILDCYEYLRLRGKETAKILLIMHTNGHTWDTFYNYYPKIRGSAYARRLDAINTFTCDKCERLVFVSEGARTAFVNDNSCYNDKCYAITNGISDRSAATDRKFESLHLVTVGTVNARKNQIALLRCLKSINDSSIKLTVIGAGEALDACKAYADEHDLSGQVSFLGSRHDVPDILDTCNVFIMSSLGEGLPISGIEALRSGLPLILTDVGGNRELIDGNGLLVDTDDGSIANAIRYFNDNKSVLPEYGKKSRAIFDSKFDAKTMMLKYVDLVKEIYESGSEV